MCLLAVAYRFRPECSLEGGRELIPAVLDGDERDPAAHLAQYDLGDSTHLLMHAKHAVHHVRFSPRDPALPRIAGRVRDFAKRSGDKSATVQPFRQFGPREPEVNRRCNLRVDRPHTANVVVRTLSLADGRDLVVKCDVDSPPFKLGSGYSHRPVSQPDPQQPAGVSGLV
jgi:hypothetical protein